MAAVSSLGLPHRQCNSPGTQAGVAEGAGAAVQRPQAGREGVNPPATTNRRRRCARRGLPLRGRSEAREAALPGPG